MAKFVYRGNKRSAEDIDRKAKEGSKDYDSVYKPGFPTFKPKEGDNQIRILPSGDPDDPDWDLTIHTHYNVGADEGRYLCLAKMKDEECPICEAASRTDDEEEKDQLRVVKGCTVWLIDRDNEKAGPQLWSMPFTKVRNEIHGRSRDKKNGTPILIDDPDEGFDISFTRTGTGTKTAYSGVEIDRDPSPLSESSKTQQKWLDFIAEHPLKDVLNYYEPEHIEKVLRGQSSAKRDAEDDDEEELKPKARRGRVEEEEEEETPRRSAKKGKEEDDDEEDTSSRRRGKKADSEEEEAEADTRASRRRAMLEEDDEEEEKPSRRSAKKGKDEEEEEDEAPFDRKKGKKAEPEEEEEEEEDDTPTASARRQLSRLGNRR